MKGKMEERTGWQESDRRRKETAECWCCRDQQRACRLHRKNLSILVLLKRKERPQCHREGSWQVRQSHLCQKEKEQSRLCKAPDCKVGESQGEREPHVCKRGMDHSGSMERKKYRLHREGRQILGRKGRASKECLSRGGRKKHERVSGSKSSPGRSAESWFHSKSGQT